MSVVVIRAMYYILGGRIPKIITKKKHKRQVRVVCCSVGILSRRKVQA